MIKRQSVFKIFIRQCSKVGTLPKNASKESAEVKKKKQIYDFDVTPKSNPLSAPFLARTIGATHNKWSAVLEKHPELKGIQRKDIENSAEILKTLNFSLADILTNPTILYYNELTLGNRYKVLRECGFEPISINILAKFVLIMNRPLALLKVHKYIPNSKDVLQGLISYLDDIQFKTWNKELYNENLTLAAIREQIMNCYFRERLGCSEEQIQKIWNTYARVRHKSFDSLKKMVKFLLEDLNFPKERIINNAFLLCADPDNAQRIVNEIKSIHGQEMKEILYKRPKIIMTSCNALLKTLEHIKSFGISEEAVSRCLEVLTLGPDTVLERLKYLQGIEQFQVLESNPRVLRLVHYQNKARLRLNYLNQIKVRCVSLHILSCSSESFAKFARNGNDRTKGRDIIIYLSKLMGKDEVNLRSLLSRHPNWCHVPPLHVKHIYDFLISRNFDIEDIYRNIHLLLYPIDRIEEKLLELNRPECLKDLDLNEGYGHLDKKFVLPLVLYMIEHEFHFTGDGLWTDQSNYQVENFNSLLPNFPESRTKIYKYGVKPAKENNVKMIQLQN